MTFFLSLAVCGTRSSRQTGTSVNNEEEVRIVLIVVGFGGVLKRDLLLACIIGGVHVGAGVTLNVLREHQSDVHWVPVLLAWNALEMVGILSILALEPNSAEVLILVAGDALRGTLSGFELVSDEELIVIEVVDGPGAIERLGDYI